MPYETPAQLRQALEDRLRIEASSGQIALNRLRRVVTFERVIIRLDNAEPGCFVLKGGMALELRLGEQARATRDIDLAVRYSTADVDALRDRLIEALARDPDNDMFSFEVGPAKPIGPAEAGRSALRFSVRALLDGREFDTLHIDLVASDEIAPTERLRLPGALEFAGIASRTVEVVATEQHFAEKFHALTRDYGDDRENTRSRDLADLLAFIEHDLVRPADVGRATEAVFEHRHTHPVPGVLADPPKSWGASYSMSATEMKLQATTVAGAMKRLRRFMSETSKREKPSA